MYCYSGQNEKCHDPARFATSNTVHVRSIFLIFEQTVYSEHMYIWDL